VHLLPLSLGRLADLAARPGLTAKFALDAVLLKLHDDNTFEAVATDAKSLVCVRGLCVAPAADFPLFPELASAPDDGTSALVPAEVWKRVFTWGRKLTTRKDVTNPACRCVAVRIGTSETTFGLSDERNPWSEAAAHVPGRYVPYEEVIANFLQQPLADRFAVSVDPVRLGWLLRIAAEFCDPSAPRADVETHGPQRILTVRAVQPGGIEFFGLLMPLLSDAPVAPTPADPERIAVLEQALAAAQTERDELARQVTDLKAALSAARARPIPGMEE
jgi:hypothetical protein